MTRLLACGALVLAALAPPAPAPLLLDLVVSGLTNPVAFVQDPSNANVQYIAEQAGRIRVLQSGVLLGTDFLSLAGQLVSGGEQGLLGLAFAPDYGTSGRFWINFTNLQGHTVIARFLRSTSNPLVANPASRVDLIWPDGRAFIAQPFANHNGGNIVFGPDGYLYIGMGDGGSADDPFSNAQNPQTLLGKMLRIDVQVPADNPQGYAIPKSNPFAGHAGILPEVWAFGMRNPWRFSFDDVSKGGTGALIIGDVGQNAWEEVDYEPRLQGGRNYGWRIREGSHRHLENPPAFPIPLTDPIIEYTRSEGATVTGGFVYRGTALGADYYGRYFYADFVLSKLWSVALAVRRHTGEALAYDRQDHSSALAGKVELPASFGVDAAGELYVLAYAAGRVYRIARADAF
jgi:glucose/arabinose dehydrogenase